MPVPAMIQAITAPSGPVAPANVRGSEKIPAPTMLPTTIAVSWNRDIFASADAIPHPIRWAAVAAVRAILCPAPPDCKSGHAGAPARHARPEYARTAGGPRRSRDAEAPD